MRWKCVANIVRKYATKSNQFHVGIVGAGPAGFYCAQQLIKIIPDCQIDIIEKLPVPFGLVRYGVAPDHPEVKNVINTFTKIALHKNVRFIGNVTLGQDLTLSQLKQSYNAVVLAYGAEEDRKLNIPGENLSNVISASKFVGWYNGLPANKSIHENLNLDVEDAVIVGQGNVALDIARILLTPVDILKKTDITEYSLEALSRSRVKNITLIGRRGPLQVSFTIKEFREILKLHGVSTKFQNGQMNGIDELIGGLQRPRKRLIQLMYDASKNNIDEEKKFNILFLRTPILIEGSEHVKGILLSKNLLEGEKAKITEQKNKLKCDIIFRSIGYRSIQIDPEIPFDKLTSTVPQNTGLYSVGWLSSGPVGVILSTMSQAFQIAELVGKHFNEGLINEPKPGYNNISRLLLKRNVITVDWEGWTRIDKEEITRGMKSNKIREKIVDIDEMVQIGGNI
ncbi:NADPH:adrenodoxin oxidoreductase, mitochondrial [Daktulosphaira vitifoliae]|uniref:NADPH:adrenodoxin oxidoreductase, mitochondrial n=1 Tax=Daktulosphaira vitifoliae TaxID=58002 RepID=UPI0021AAAF48|nr:NADPH:adrenodoxin oxidoreductase, mitochondrial [Daktulosphaira vitifoliae]XP_050538305.1 NADPH:adrenodoxin oxidoreductase, mitochondrial [Daktulosphaira vitifoliae]XP_050538306.1 NADPH:adrenodoxin oxidoreductase, mitochondrial [Daktulosphaira vitifoliae]XP_050538307.1 NADPH:adrenodoxin oxidoreductase, mitochondrial [Daktulosphaira vitifoliae]